MEAAREVPKMKGMFIRGALIIFSLGVITFLLYFILDFITKLFRPAFKPLVGEDYLVTIMGVAAILFLIWAVGFIFSPQNLTGRWGRFWGRIPVVNWFMGEKRIPQSVHDMPGALVKFSDGSYYIAALIGEQKFRDKSGETHKMYRLYCPSAPVPWSGLPLIFARSDQVILLKLSFAEIYGITTSFGRTTPELLEELEFKQAIQLDEAPSPETKD
jgi:uncharacterized membrane protein